VATRILVNPPARLLGQRNAIVSGTIPANEPENHVVSDFAGPLSIKFMLDGRGFWQTPGGLFCVEGNAFLVLNEGQVYSLHMGGGEPRESFCPMFASGFVAEAERVLRASEDILLDQPEPPAAPGPGFFEHVRSSNPNLLGQLRRMRDVFCRGVDDAADAWLEEQFHALAEQLIRIERGEKARRALVPAVRLATREELFSRLHRARDFMHAHATRPLALAEIARAGCLSPHHFLRLFRALFGCTPHRYLTRLRIERACALLRSTDRTVTEVCLELGFESLGSFSRLFRREVGVPPASFRARCNRKFAITEKPRGVPLA